MDNQIENKEKIKTRPELLKPTNEKMILYSGFLKSWVPPHSQWPVHQNAGRSQVTCTNIPWKRSLTL